MRQLVRQSPSSGNRNVEWAISTFRPLLQALHLQEHKSGPTVVKASDYRNLIIKGMGRCVVVVQKQRIRDGQKGYFIFDYKKDVDLFFLSIVLDESLYSDEGLDCNIRRKSLEKRICIQPFSAFSSKACYGIFEDIKQFFYRFQFDMFL